MTWLLVSCGVGVALFTLYLLHLFLVRLFLLSEKKVSSPVEGGSHPYRSPLEGSSKEESIPPKQKKTMKLNFKLGKYSKAFSYLVLACACVTGIGIIYDVSFFGVGVKTCGGIALAGMALFFVLLVFDVFLSNSNQ